MVKSLKERVAWRLRRYLMARPKAARSVTSEKVCVAGLLSSSSGLGAGARYCVQALEASGVPTSTVDLSAEFGHDDFDSPARADRSGPSGAGQVVIHINGPEFERACFLLNLWKGHGKKVIGYWAWELPTPPPGWEAALAYLHEVWTPSSFVADAIRPLTDKPVRVIPHFVPQVGTAGASANSDQIGSASFLIIADGRSSFARKNVAASIRAFQDGAKSAASRLFVKLRSARLYPQHLDEVRSLAAQDSRIVLVDRVLNAHQYGALLDEADVLLSLHRSEGFGFPMAECMARGKPVIATGWSGNMDFMDAQSAALVPYSLVPVNDPCGVYQAAAGAVWAEPDQDAAVKILAELEADPDLRAAIGRRARSRVSALGDPARWEEAVRRA